MMTEAFTVGFKYYPFLDLFPFLSFFLIYFNFSYFSCTSFRATTWFRPKIHNEFSSFQASFMIGINVLYLLYFLSNNLIYMIFVLSRTKTERVAQEKTYLMFDFQIDKLKQRLTQDVGSDWQSPYVKCLALAQKLNFYSNRCTKKWNFIPS